MNINTATLDLLYAMDVERRPEKHRWLQPEPEEENDRFVVIGEEVFDDQVMRGFGGCWPELHDALASYDWNAGAPVYVIDLWANPERALMDVKLTPSIAHTRSFIDQHGGPTL